MIHIDKTKWFEQLSQGAPALRVATLLSHLDKSHSNGTGKSIVWTKVNL
jgi:hypothetical protein